eukprot:SAG25_NODE_324_length_9786_cov_33.460308_11_plen_258_part_00
MWGGSVGPAGGASVALCDSLPVGGHRGAPPVAACRVSTNADQGIETSTRHPSTLSPPGQAACGASDEGPQDRCWGYGEGRGVRLTFSQRRSEGGEGATGGESCPTDLLDLVDIFPPNRAAADRFGDPPILLMRRKLRLRCGRLTRLTVGSAPQRFPAGTSRNIAGQAVCTSAPCTAHGCRRPFQRRQPPWLDLLSGRLAVKRSAPTGRGGIVYRRDLLFLAHHPSLVYPLRAQAVSEVKLTGTNKIDFRTFRQQQPL